jgi:hypothetical protein
MRANYRPVEREVEKKEERERLKQEKEKDWGKLGRHTQSISGVKKPFGGLFHVKL